MIGIGIALIAVGLSLAFIYWLASGEDPQRISPAEYPYTTSERKLLSRLDNEVRGEMRYDESIVRGRYPLYEPTLNGRLKMIEKHLGISTTIEPSKPAKLKIKKEK